MKPTSSKNWPYSTCAISVRRKGQIELVVCFLVLSATKVEIKSFYGLSKSHQWSFDKSCQKIFTCNIAYNVVSIYLPLIDFSSFCLSRGLGLGTATDGDIYI